VARLILHRLAACASFTCTDGWTAKTAVPAENIACLAGVCTSSTCCNPPTCESAAPLIPLACDLKRNARSIQCRGQTPSGCNTELCCTRQPSCGAHGWTVYFANYLNDVRVRKMVLDFDFTTGDVSLRAGSIRNVSRPGGGDGIILNPQNPNQLFVGGQQERIFVINVSNPNPDTNWWRQFTTGSRVFHVVAIDDETIVGSHVDGWTNVSYSKLVGGTLPDRSTATIVPVTGAVPKVVSLIPVSNGRILYTTSTEAGEPGNVGFATISTSALATQTPLIQNVRAHNGVFRPSTGALYLWGQRTVSQYTLAGALVASIDVTALIGEIGTPGARHVDNGVIFADRWLLIAVNAGKLIWFDLAGAASIADARSGSFIVTPSDEFDAFTLPVCVRA
jgi:hypothetical protein